MDSPIVFVTNRFNLLEILSSGLLVPRSAFGKYYPDFLELSHNRIPLFQAPLNAELLARVSSQDEGSFPVAIEIESTKLAPTPVAALVNGATESASLVPNAASMWSAGGVVPSLAKVHFRSAQDLEEHKLREYENIFPNSVPLTVSPTVFDAGRLSLADVEKWLASLPSETGVSPEDFLLQDRLSGGRCLAAFACPPEWVGGLAEFLGTKNIAQGHSPKFPSWITVENTATPRETGWRGKSQEERVYCTAVKVLRRVSPAEAWRPLEVLADVQAGVAATQLSKKDEAQLSKQFVAVGGILRNEREFRPFKTGVGNPVVKALLMVLMRPEPARLLNWSRADSGAEEDVHLTSAVLAGVLQGHKRLSTTFRSAELDRLIAHVTAHEICRKVPRGFRPAAGLEVTISDQPAAREGGTVLKIIWDGVAVLTKLSRRRELVDLLARLDLTQSGVARAIADICLEHRWTECVRSIVTTMDKKWSAAPRAEGLEILVQGPVSVRVEIQPEALRERLQDDSLPASVEQRIANALRSLSDIRDAPQPDAELRKSSGVPKTSAPSRESITRNQRS